MKSADITPRGAVQVRGNGRFHFRSLERGERAVVTEAVADTDFFLFKNGSGTRRCHANCQRRRSADRKKQNKNKFFFFITKYFSFSFCVGACDGRERERGNCWAKTSAGADTGGCDLLPRPDGPIVIIRCWAEEQTASRRASSISTLFPSDWTTAVGVLSAGTDGRQVSD